MSLQQLYDLVIADEVPPYDQRLAVAMSEQQYIQYAQNQGHTYYLFLNKLVRRLRPKKVLELGTSIGRSALFMMTALPTTSSLVTVDIGSFLRTDLFGFAHDSRLKIIFGDDLNDLIYEQVGSGFDLFFIDSEHSLEQVALEWEKYKSRLVDGAIVIMDDIHLNLGMTQFWDSLPYEKIDTGDKLHFSGFGLFVYKR